MERSNIGPSKTGIHDSEPTTTAIVVITHLYLRFPFTNREKRPEPLMRALLRLALACLWGIGMKPLSFALCVVSAFGSLSAQRPEWQPSPEHTQVITGWPQLVEKWLRTIGIISE
jgi:hypothetical protein